MVNVITISSGTAVTDAITMMRQVSHFAVYGEHVDSMYEFINKVADTEGEAINFLQDHLYLRKWNNLFDCRKATLHSSSSYVVTSASGSRNSVERFVV